jgi:signal transduction histidine kinase
VKKLRISLGIKILGLISLLTFVAFLCLFVANTYWMRQITLHQVDRLGLRVSELLTTLIDGPMRRGDDEGTHEQFQIISRMYEDIMVYLTDFRGNITYSTEPGVLRLDLTSIYGQEEISAMLAQSLKKGLDAGTLLELEGRPYYLRVQSIANAPECYHCHGSTQPILGALLEFQDMHPDFAKLRTMQVYGGGLALISLVALLTTMLIYLRARLLRRIEELSRVSQEIRQGNYSADFIISGDDELGELGKNLSSMVHRLQTAEKFAAIGEFSTYIAHEIRNPLFAIGGFANTLLRTPNLDSTSMQKIQIILKESTRLDNILRTFINFSRPLEAAMVPVNPNRIVRDVLDLIDFKKDFPQVKARLFLDEDASLVRGDPELIKQCLLNLIKNALSTMPEGGYLDVFTHNGVDNVVIEITDTGVGLPQEVLEHPFNPFTSLELAMTRKIIVDLGGELHLESDPGTGTSSLLRLPKYKG